jgi:hypothetical protein
MRENHAFLTGNSTQKKTVVKYLLLPAMPGRKRRAPVSSP